MMRKIFIWFWRLLGGKKEKEIEVFKFFVKINWEKGRVFKRKEMGFESFGLFGLEFVVFVFVVGDGFEWFVGWIELYGFGF